jgi:hypothetical protein
MEVAPSPAPYYEWKETLSTNTQNPSEEAFAEPWSH